MNNAHPQSQAQWERELDRLRNLVEGLDAEACETLFVLAHNRLGVLQGKPITVLVEGPGGWTGRTADVVRALNQEGLRLYRLGHPAAQAFAAVATPADKAQADIPFQRLLAHVTTTPKGT